MVLRTWSINCFQPGDDCTLERVVAGQGAKQNARSWKPVAVEKKGCGRYVVIMCVQNES